MKQNNHKGFTLIELLVVIAIIGILATLAVVSLNNARTRARDSKRLSDIRNTQTALELYYTDNSAYPAEATSGVCAPNTTLEGCCLDASSGGAAGPGWLAEGACAPSTDRLISVPNDPRNSGANDNYIYDVSATSSSYSILLNLETGTGELAAGLACATPSGIKNVAAAVNCTP